MTEVKLGAFKVERRAVAAAIFSGVRLEYAQVRQLSSHDAQAELSAAGFVGWLCRSFHLPSVALEAYPAGEDTRRTALNATVVSVLREQGIAVWAVSRQELLTAFGSPPLSTRKELRAVAAVIWPVIAGAPQTRWTLEAAALGLYVQTNRFLNF